MLFICELVDIPFAGDEPLHGTALYCGTDEVVLSGLHLWNGRVQGGEDSVFSVASENVLQIICVVVLCGQAQRFAEVSKCNLGFLQSTNSVCSSSCASLPRGVWARLAVPPATAIRTTRKYRGTAFAFFQVKDTSVGRSLQRTVPRVPTAEVTCGKYRYTLERDRFERVRNDP